MNYRLLDTFRATFEGKVYRHRSSVLGDHIAMHLYEDLYALGRSAAFRDHVARRRSVLNSQNRRRGVKARRGDGTFGGLVPGVDPVEDPGFGVARGPIATVEVGVEVKILAKAMLKQIDRVISDLKNQVAQFRRGGGEPICVGVVGVNHAAVTTSYEGSRTTTTDGKTHRHPYQEADEAERRLKADAGPVFDEFIVLRYRATNTLPYSFEWVDLPRTELDYGASLTRIAAEYDRRFR